MFLGWSLFIIGFLMILARGLLARSVQRANESVGATPPTPLSFAFVGVGLVIVGIALVAGLIK